MLLEEAIEGDKATAAVATLLEEDALSCVWE